MFRTIYNHAKLTFRISVVDPLLIKSGVDPIEPGAADMTFVRTAGADGKPTVYLPGSSLKGVLRSQAERILRTALGANGACDPLQDRGKCRDLDPKAGTAGVYKGSCEACRLFGSTVLAGRLRLGDARPTEETLHLDTRYHVAIDRARQSVAHGPFDTEVVVAGSFQARLDLDNFTLGQLAVTLQVLGDLDEGLIQIGHSKSRGYGGVKLGDSLRLEYRSLGGSGLLVAGALENEPSYGLPSKQEEVLDAAGSTAGPAHGLWRNILIWEGSPAVFQLLDRLAKGPARAFYKPALRGGPA